MNIERRKAPAGRDLLGYGGKAPDPRWPDGARVAVSLVVNFEEGAEFAISEGDPENETVYEVDQRLVGRPIPVSKAISNTARARAGGG